MSRPVLLLLLALLPLLAGCASPTGPTPTASIRNEVYREFVRLDGLHGNEALKAEINRLHSRLESLARSQQPASQAEAVKVRLAIAYCWERLGDREQAIRLYTSLVPARGVSCTSPPGREYEAFGWFRAGLLAEHQARHYAQASRDPDLTPEERQEAAERYKVARRQAITALEHCANYPLPPLDPLTGKPLPVGLMRTPEVGPDPAKQWESVDLRQEAYRRLDAYYRDTVSYQVFDFLVRACGGKRHSASYALALVVLALLAKLVTTPLSLTQYRSLRAMQAIQPELKRLQEKYRNDPQQLAKAQMQLFRDHGVNPASSCLPMLIQVPILMWVYFGIRHYTYQFMGKSFLYLPSLGDPDVIRIGDALWPGPLLVVYGLSMYLSQRLISPPAATREQQQQQKLLSYMMPVIFILIMKQFPAAFIFYWLMMNILMTGHQYLVMRPQRPAAGEAEGPDGPPPPRAIRKLTEESRPAAKKKKKR